MGGKAIASIPGLIYALNDPVICVRASVAKVLAPWDLRPDRR